MSSDPPLLRLQLVHSTPYPCAYLPEREARSLIAIPPPLVDATVYNHLIRSGFRRSGPLVYRPDCDGCCACTPARLRVADFQPDRSQRRALKRHANLFASEQALAYREEHYALYRRYQIARHRDGGMDEDDREQYERFLLCSRTDSRLIEFQEEGKLCMISLIDLVADGLSAVYCFFDPDIPGASFGTYNILWQASRCHKLGLPYLYLGYWIADSRKMAYKAQFQPLEILEDSEWRSFHLQDKEQ